MTYPEYSTDLLHKLTDRTYIVFTSEQARDEWVHRQRTMDTVPRSEHLKYAPSFENVLGIIANTGFGEFYARPVRKDKRRVAKKRVGANDSRQVGTLYRTRSAAFEGLCEHLSKRSAA